MKMMFSCKFPNCDRSCMPEIPSSHRASVYSHPVPPSPRLFSSTDACRKHVRKTHPEWLEQQVRNGNAAISLLKLKRYKVKGDGSCWVYAILACAGLCESRSLTAEQTPTSRDRGMDRVCRNLAYLWLFDHQNVMLRDEIETLDEILDKLPQHPMVDDDDFGSFGTINTVMGLAA